jgi:hypothetical protein
MDIYESSHPYLAHAASNARHASANGSPFIEPLSVANHVVNNACSTYGNGMRVCIE